MGTGLGAVSIYWLAPLMVCAAPVILLPLGVFLFASSRRTETGGPRCGACGYNLTGSQSNRCPECGKLFIEAGVNLTATHLLAGRRRLGVTLIVAALVLPLLSGVMTSISMLNLARAQAAQAAVAARQAQQQSAAVNQFLRQTLEATDAAASRPAANASD